MKKILVTDDERNICSMLKGFLELSGYAVDVAYDGLSAIDKVRDGGYDLVLMDVMMPTMDGYTAVKNIRQFSSVPIAMLTALAEDEDKVRAYELGVDDYIEKPFSLKLVALHVGAILRRMDRNEEDAEVYKVGELTLDNSSRLVYVRGEARTLTPKVFSLLRCLMRTPSKVVTRETFISQVWGYDYDGFDRTLDTHIKFLRKDISPLSHYIVTVRGVGYKIEPTE